MADGIEVEQIQIIESRPKKVKNIFFLLFFSASAIDFSLTIRMHKVTDIKTHACGFSFTLAAFDKKKY